MHETIECLVIDDEPLARKGMANLIAQVPRLHLAGSCANPTEALHLLHERHIDLLFLDIHMPRMSGLELLRALPHPPLTIIATAFPNHALESYELDVVDYLMKPVPLDRFVKAVSKARELLDARAARASSEERQADHFFVKCENGYERIAYDDLLYVEAMENYVVLHTATARFVCYLTFKGMEEQLPADRFLKVHKSYIVSRSKVQRVEAASLMVGSKEIPISRALKEEVLQALLKDRVIKR